MDLQNNLIINHYNLPFDIFNDIIILINYIHNYQDQIPVIILMKAIKEGGQIYENLNHPHLVL